MASWQEFAAAQPALAARGAEVLLLGKQAEDQLESGLAYLATVRRDGGPRVHPISPVLHDGRLYAFVLRRSPKRADLLRDGRYALHSFPYPLDWAAFTDEEFYLEGRAILEDDPVLRQAVAASCGDDVDTGDVFELQITLVLHKARPDGKLTYTRWRDT